MTEKTAPNHHHQDKGKKMTLEDEVHYLRGRLEKLSNGLIRADGKIEVALSMKREIDTLVGKLDHITDKLSDVTIKLTEVTHMVMAHIDDSKKKEGEWMKLWRNVLGSLIIALLFAVLVLVASHINLF